MRKQDMLQAQAQAVRAVLHATEPAMCGIIPQEAIWNPTLPVLTPTLPESAVCVTEQEGKWFKFHPLKISTY